MLMMKEKKERKGSLGKEESFMAGQQGRPVALAISVARIITSNSKTA
jgi:hypothetical protein